MKNISDAQTAADCATKPIDFYVFPRKDALGIAPISQPFLANWEAARPGVLEDIDIFLPNSRTFKHPNTRYDLFRRVESVDSETVIVCENWLELLNADGLHHKIADLMGAVRALYPFNPKVWSWNSDIDEAIVFDLQDLPENEFVLCFNTSRPWPHDIVLPFFNVDCRPQWSPSDTRPIRGGFIGFVGSVEVRQKMRYGFAGRRGWEIMATEREGRVPQEEYLRRMMQWDFALCPRGGGLGSYRTMEAIQCGTIPVMFTDDLARPYPDLKWDFSFIIPEKDAGNFELVTEILSHHDVKELRQRLAAVRERFTLAGVQKTIYKRISDYLS